MKWKNRSGAPPHVGPIVGPVDVAVVQVEAGDVPPGLPQDVAVEERGRQRGPALLLEKRALLLG
jgi:hypothetical protein